MATLRKIEAGDERKSGRRTTDKIYADSVTQINKWILVGITALYILSVMAFMFVPDNGKVVFDSVRTFLPAVATLVIGYFFGRN